MKAPDVIYANVFGACNGSLQMSVRRMTANDIAYSRVRVRELTDDECDKLITFIMLGQTEDYGRSSIRQWHAELHGVINESA